MAELARISGKSPVSMARPTSSMRFSGTGSLASTRQRRASSSRVQPASSRAPGAGFSGRARSIEPRISRPSWAAARNLSRSSAWMTTGAGVAMRAAAVAGLAKRGAPDLEAILLAAIDDAAASVRIAAANSVFDTATREGRELLNPQVMSAVFGDSPSRPPSERRRREDRSARRPQESEWDRWLKRLYAGEHRPDFLAATVPPLQRLLASPQPDERAAAAGAGAAGTRRTGAAGADGGRACRSQNARHGSPVVAVAPLVRPAAHLQELLPLAVNAQQLATLIQYYTEVVEIQHAESLWKLLADERLIGVGVDEVIRGLQKVYLGEASYNSSEGLTASQRRATSEAVNRWLETGTDWQRIAALVLLVRVDPDGVNEPAARMADDEQRSVAIREIAFQIELASQTSADRKSHGWRGLGTRGSRRRRLALQLRRGASTLADSRTSDDSLTYMGISTSDEDSASVGRRSGEPIVPTPPTGTQGRTGRAAAGRQRSQGGCPRRLPLDPLRRPGRSAALAEILALEQGGSGGFGQVRRSRNCRPERLVANPGVAGSTVPRTRSRSGRVLLDDPDYRWAEICRFASRFAPTCRNPDNCDPARGLAARRRPRELSPCFSSLPGGNQPHTAEKERARRIPTQKRDADATLLARSVQLWKRSSRLRRTPHQQGDHAMTYRFGSLLITALVLLLASPWQASGQWAGAGIPFGDARPGSVMGTGSVSTPLQPTTLRMHIELQAEGKTLPEALSELERPPRSGPRATGETQG